MNQSLQQVIKAAPQLPSAEQQRFAEAILIALNQSKRNCMAINSLPTNAIVLVVTNIFIYYLGGLSANRNAFCAASPSMNSSRTLRR